MKTLQSFDYCTWLVHDKERSDTSNFVVLEKNVLDDK